MKEVLITVDFYRAEASSVNIAELLKPVRSAQILAGDPKIAVQVRVHERELARLKAAVMSACILEAYSDLDLYSYRRA